MDLKIKISAALARVKQSKILSADNMKRLSGNEARESLFESFGRLEVFEGKRNVHLSLQTAELDRERMYVAMGHGLNVALFPDSFNGIRTQDGIVLEQMDAYHLSLTNCLVGEDLLAQDTVIVNCDKKIRLLSLEVASKLFIVMGSGCAQDKLLSLHLSEILSGSRGNTTRQIRDRFWFSECSNHR